MTIDIKKSVIYVMKKLRHIHMHDTRVNKLLTMGKTNI